MSKLKPRTIAFLIECNSFISMFLAGIFILIFIGWKTGRTQDTELILLGYALGFAGAVNMIISPIAQLFVRVCAGKWYHYPEFFVGLWIATHTGIAFSNAGRLMQVVASVLLPGIILLLIYVIFKTRNKGVSQKNYAP